MSDDGFVRWPATDVLLILHHVDGHLCAYRFAQGTEETKVIDARCISEYETPIPRDTPPANWTPTRRIAATARYYVQEWISATGDWLRRQLVCRFRGHRPKMSRRGRCVVCGNDPKRGQNPWPTTSRRNRSPSAAERSRRSGSGS